ncbi:possible phospodiesterase [Oceanicola granulosus HTCC2516]|uniref:Possible phospodiesterase n=1 Tax=Oceanicola granulosus (strain ATCC BAA-861 / DSM 15982 / KCTC 12143 / HTCC2516) TaxID=314256 RepID=Q2CJW1_OCEGH|nr:metallophosphoesterase family protein [Oceanicola granulosus]EAR53028.1 possible phospodiesterase [Oceanicola granulosus HTCC2516]
MSRILHLSDLHFGRDRAELEAPLLRSVDKLAPDLVAISGDFTQRARVGQFERARRFLEKIGQPWLAVPGNHDTPLDNLLVRAFAPWKRYREAISDDLEPNFENENVVVAGVNTVNPFSWQRGHISRRTVNRVCAAFANIERRVRIVMLHHPLQHGPEVDKRLMRGANEALARLEECGADIVLSGHLHNTIVRPFRAAPGLLFVQAGTSLSDRLRGEPNTFNLLDVAHGEVAITSYSAGDDAEFTPDAGVTYARGESGWSKLEP